MTANFAPFHAGERAAQRLSGKGESPVAPIRDYMPDQHREFFAQAPFLLAAAADDDWPVPTLLTGAPGFVQSPDPRRLTIAARPQDGDPAAALLTPGAPVGLLGIDLATRRRNRANGRVAAAGPDGLEITVLESFGNCPKYIQGRVIERPSQPSAAGALETFDGLDAAARDAIAAADCLFVASVALGGVDISHRGGRPGFVKLEGERLIFPDFAGNRYFNTLGNLLLNPKAAILAVDFERGDLTCLQGLATIDWRKPDAGPQGAERSWSLAARGGWRRRGALPLRWRFRDYAPSTEATGLWP